MHYDNAQSIIRWPCVYNGQLSTPGGHTCFLWVDTVAIVNLGREVEIVDEDRSMVPPSRESSPQWGLMVRILSMSRVQVDVWSESPRFHPSSQSGLLALFANIEIHSRPP